MKKIKIHIILLSILSLLLISCNMVIYSKLFETASTVLYNDNNSTSGVIPSGPVVYSPGNVITVLGNTGALVKTGFTFIGWNTARDGSGSTYTAGQTFTIGKASVILYALWQASITFDANGGIGIMPMLQINYNASRTLLPNAFTRVNYHFTGWNTVAAAAIAEYNDESAYLMENGDITLYAIWSGDNYAITFNANGATGIMGDQSIAFGATSNISPILFSRTGYSFYGWTVTSGSTTRDYLDNAPYTMSSAGATLYAIWIGTIIFDKNAFDATGTMANQTIYYNNSAALNANGFFRTGYTFAGWNTIALGGGTSFANSAAYDLDLGSGTLYAQWTVNQYAVTYDANGSTGGSVPIGSPFTINYGTVVTVLGNTGGLYKTGFTFTGWNTASDGSGTTYTVGQTFNMGTSAVTLYAQWSINLTLINSQNFGSASDLALSGNYLYISGGSSFRVYDISNPAAPSLMGTKTSSAQVDEIAVSGGFVFIGNYSNNSLEIYNASTPYASVSSCSATGNNWIYGLFVSSNYAYASTGGSYLQIFNISTPVSPFLNGYCSIVSGAAYDVYVSGNYAYVADSSVGLKIIDITIPATPAVIGTCTTGTSAQGVTISGNYAYLAAGTSGLIIINISTPSSPVLVSTFDTPGDAIAVAVSGNYAFVADGTSGLQVIDISNPANPKIVGNYSTGGNANGVKISGQYIYVSDFVVGLIIFYCPAL